MLTTNLQRAFAAYIVYRHAVAQRLNDDRGEGVISTGIAVLIVALLGAAAYVVFRQILTDAGDRARNGVGGIR